MRKVRAGEIVLPSERRECLQAVVYERGKLATGVRVSYERTRTGIAFERVEKMEAGKVFSDLLPPWWD